jgi:hypothetical protein
MPETDLRDAGKQEGRTLLQRLGGWFRTGGWKAIAGASLGAAALATYSYFIGCHSGTCILTSNVRTATLFGGVIGMVAGWPAAPKAPAAAQKS